MGSTTQAFGDGVPSDSSDMLQLAYKYCSARLKKKVNGIVQDVNTQSFQNVVDFVRKNNSKKQGNVVGRIGTPLPVGLLVVGGISSIDHAKSFRVLCSLLNTDMCCSANLHGGSLLKSKVWNAHSEAVSKTLNSLLKQVSGLETDADDACALANWHEECGRGRTVAVVVEEVEAADPEVLKELVHVLSDLGSKIPISLLLGLSTLGNHLYDILPSNVVSRTIIQKFETKPSMQQMDALIEHLFLDLHDLLPFSLCPRTISYLDEHFLRRDMSLDAFEKSIHFALVNHFFAEPLCAILPCFEYIADRSHSKPPEVNTGEIESAGVLKDVNKLPENLLERLRKNSSLFVGSSGDWKKHLQLAIQMSIRSRREWVLALRLLNISAAHVGCTGAGSGFTFRELHRDASDPSYFAKSTDYGNMSSGLHLVAKLRSKIEELPRDSVLALVEKWEDLLQGKLGLLADALKELEDVKEELQSPTLSQGTTELPSKDFQDDKSGFLSNSNAQAESDSENKLTSKPTRLSAARRKGALIAHVNALALSQKQNSKGHADRDITRGVGARLGDLLFDVAVHHAAKCPINLPGAELFCLSAFSSLKQSFLEPSPRHALEEVLQNPTQHIPFGKLSSCMQGGSNHHDWYVAYQSLQKFDRVVDMQEWCASFSDGVSIKQLPSTGKADCHKHRNVGKQAADSRPQKAVRLTQQLRQRKSRSSASNTRRFDWSSKDPLVVRFLQSVRELQISGIVRPCKRRQGEYVEHLVHDGSVPEVEGIEMED
uniref:Origin recognition complex subunit 3 n=1 Tax=Picocystis salinarum TaxID=88271 RepID=A0A7S3UD27_9CHLO